MKQMKTILVSACLLGVNCRYSGDGQLLDGIACLMEKTRIVPVCPEQLGGLPTPRPAAERRGDRVVTRSGEDFTARFERGAREVLALAQRFGADTALLKERSPSCGAGVIYDGSFSHTRVPGDGVTAALLMANGIRVLGESELPKLIDELNREEESAK